MFLGIADEGPTLETLDFAFYIGSTPTFLYFDFYLAQSHDIVSILPGTHVSSS